MLEVVDLRTPPAETVSRSEVANEIVAGLVPVLRKGRGKAGSQWYLEVEKPFPVASPRDPPGTAFAVHRELRTGSIGLGGIRFSVSARREPTGKVLVGWVAWQNESIITQIRDDIIAAIERDRELLGSLCPFDEPDSAPSLPWLALLRMPPWRQLSATDEEDLAKIRACIGWAAIEALSGG